MNSYRLALASIAALLGASAAAQTMGLGASSSFADLALPPPPKPVSELKLDLPLAPPKAKFRDLARAHATGTLVPLTGTRLEYIPEAARPHRLRPVELMRPVAPAPNLVTDMNAILMSQELLNQIEGRANAILGPIYFRSTFYREDPALIDSNRHRRVQRPYGLTEEQDLAMRREIAFMAKGYMIKTGIPRFLQSREDTQEIAQTYNEALASTQASFVQKTESGSVWTYNMAFDPFRPDGKYGASAGASNERWGFSAGTAVWKKSVTTLTDLGVRVSRAIQLRGFGDYLIENDWAIIGKNYHPRLSRWFTPATRGALEWNIPYGDPQRWYKMVTTVSMSYSF